MLLTLASILVVAWFAGIVGMFTLGTAVRLLLVNAVVVLLLVLLSSRRPAGPAD